MKKLNLPPTVRRVKESEAPGDDAISKRIAESYQANIVEGYVLKTDMPDGFINTFYAEVNIDYDRLWNLFKSLIAIFPDEVSLIFHHIDEEPLYGKYMDKYELMNYLDTISTELTMDPFLEFGVIFNTEDFLEEIFVTATKYIQYWGMDKNLFEDKLKLFEIYPTENLNFIDEYPVVREVLTRHNSQIMTTGDLINKLKEKFIEE